LTETSSLPKAAAAAGIAYPQLCQRMVELALKHPTRNSKSKSDHEKKAAAR
jgi:hypothetical protein